MIFSGDPYRILGLPPGAPLPEVKRAYRRLAKEFHPDRAGPAALPRFLAIKAAYEMLVGPPGSRSVGSRAARSPGPPRPSQGWATGTGRGWATGTKRPTAGGAEPGTAPGSDRSDRSTRAGGAVGGSSTEAGSTRAAGAAGARTGPGASEADPFAWARQGRRRSETDERRSRRDGSAAGRGGAADAGTNPGRNRTAGTNSGPGGAADAGTNPAPGRGRTRRAATRRATLGSTSYDDAVHEEERVWHGATWYGVTTGTYWRPNPREYADPRKHGPEYEARARRAAAGLPVDEAAPGPAHGGSADPTDSSAGHRPDPDRGPTPARSAAPSAAEPLPERAIGALLASPGRARFVFALAGWPLLALLAVGGAGELTGCGRYAAGCPVDAETWTLLGRLAAAGLFAALLALPSVALRATIASLVAFVVAAPGAALLAVFGGSRDPAGASGALTVLVAGAWLVGAVGAATGRLRLPPTVRARVPWWT